MQEMDTSTENLLAPTSKYSTRLTLLTPSTGETKVPLPKSKIKDNALHAGLSLLLEQWKASISLSTENSSLSQSNSLLTAPTKTMDALEV